MDYRKMEGCLSSVCMDYKEIDADLFTVVQRSLGNTLKTRVQTPPKDDYVLFDYISPNLA